MPEVYRMLNISRTTYLTYCLNLKSLDLVWLSICLKNTEKSAESREQRAESRKQRAESSGRCPPGDKTHLAGGGGHRPIHGPQDRDRHQNSEAR